MTTKTTIEELVKKFSTPPTAMFRIERHPVIARYPLFCADLLRRFPAQHFVFFERDALALMWVMEELLGETAKKRLHTIFLNRTMLPKSLWHPSVTFDENVPISKLYAVRTQRIVDYQPSRKKNKAVRFVRQELRDVPNGSVLIDTSYWGTMPLFVRETLPKKHFEVAWVVGPHGSPAFLPDGVGENGNAVYTDDFFPFGYDADGLVVGEDGHLHPRSIYVSPHEQKTFEERQSALREFTRRWVAQRSGVSAGAQQGRTRSEAK